MRLPSSVLLLLLAVILTRHQIAAGVHAQEFGGELPGRTLSALIFALVTCAFATVYITQPVLPVLQAQFGVGASAASLTVSAVIVGIAVTTLPIGMLVDRYPARLLMIAGACMTAGAGAVCATTSSFPMLVAMRAVQGAFIPALTTCVAAWLARTLPARALNVAMGTYVSATVAGGLGGRLLAGWAFSPAHWRHAFIAVGAALFVVTLLVAPRLRETALTKAVGPSTPLFHLVLRRPQVLAQVAAFGAFGAFSTVFNYFPFYLSRPPWSLSTPTITALYLVYVAGLVMGPVAGRLANRFGNGAVMAVGALLLEAALAATLVVSIPALIASLVALCLGFFAIHAAAVGALNRSLSAERGKGNALYTLFYYLGGASGIAAGGSLYARAGWPGIVAVSLVLSLLPLGVGMISSRGAVYNPSTTQERP